MAAAHKRCSLVFVHKIDGILKIQCRIKMKKGRWNVPFHYELRFTDSGNNPVSYKNILNLDKSLVLDSPALGSFTLYETSTVLESFVFKKTLYFL